MSNLQRGEPAFSVACECLLHTSATILETHSKEVSSRPYIPKSNLL